MTYDTGLEELEKTALWIIMDPWETSPYERDNLREPNLDKLNEEVLIRIVDYLPKLNHVLVSCSVYENKRKVKLHNLIKHIRNVNHNTELLNNYIQNNNIKDIVYTGFHHGRCILSRDVGAKALSEKTDLRLYIKRDLVATLPWDDEIDADRKSLCFVNFI